MVSNVRQNFHEECEASINKQINQELQASYVYMALAAHYDRDDVAFPNAAKMFRAASHEEREHAEKLIDYQNKRGGRVLFQDIKTPTQIPGNATLAYGIKAALDYEKLVNQCLLDLHSVASKHNDAQMTDFIEGEFLKEQVDAIKKLSDQLTNVQRVGTGLGEYMFDRMTLNEDSA
ncbi:fts3-like protein [Cichlidogyrus casuarinus]|uniref:Ferritin n=1 Tax=Cichlidogyrus casuarinus TaxID=1844966 RepID=A0ABD2PMT7_9PLAT